jgi:hypothetical protein
MIRMSIKKKAFLHGCLLLIFMASGCATKGIKVDSTTNPPPVNKFSDFGRFELREIAIADEYSGYDANINAKIKIEETLRSNLDQQLKEWNQSDHSKKRGTLIIEPKIVQIKFISGGARFWAGALAGSSAVNMEVIYREKETGEVIASPQFYQHAAAMAGAYSFGGADNAMLERIANIIADYTIANYNEAVGGPTGKPSP